MNGIDIGICRPMVTPSNNDGSNPPSSSIPGPVNNGNNGHSDLSMNDWIRLNFLKGSTSNMLNKMAPRYNYSDFH